MTVTESELKQFVFTQGATTITKRYTSTIAYTVTLTKGTTTLNLTQTEYEDMAAVFLATTAQTYTDPI